MDNIEDLETIDSLENVENLKRLESRELARESTKSIQPKSLDPRNLRQNGDFKKFREFPEPG